MCRAIAGVETPHRLFYGLFYKLCYAGFAMAVSTAAVAADYYVPMPVYRTGPYAAVGTSYYGGVIDYYKFLNKRDGGIGNVKIVWDECETGYKDAQGIACYNRQKEGKLGKALYFDPLSASISSALIVQGRTEKIPIISVNQGRVATGRGDVFPYQFPLGANAYDFAHATVKYMGQRLGGIGKLKGEKIVTLFHGSPYGREANEFMTALGERYGFEHVLIEVPHPGSEQGSQWLKIRRLKPTFVFLRGWGSMNPFAIITAARSGYPVSQIIGNEWSNSDEDVIPAGAAADGYQAVTAHRSGADFPIAREITEKLYNYGEGTLEDKDLIGSTYWNLGIWVAVMSSEAIRLAQKRFGKELTGAMLRWGFENIELTQDDLSKIGFADVAPPIKVTCLDHSGLHKARFQQWDADARKWEIISDWIDGRSETSQKLIDRDAEKYIAEHPQFPQRECSDLNSRDNFDI